MKIWEIEIIKTNTELYGEPYYHKSDSGTSTILWFKAGRLACRYFCDLNKFQDFTGKHSKEEIYYDSGQIAAQYQVFVGQLKSLFWNTAGKPISAKEYLTRKK